MRISRLALLIVTLVFALSLAAVPMIAVQEETPVTCSSDLVLNLSESRIEVTRTPKWQAVVDRNAPPHVPRVCENGQSVTGRG